MNDDFPYFYKLIRSHVVEGFSLTNYEFDLLFDYIENHYSDYITVKRNSLRFIRARNFESVNEYKLKSHNQSWSKNLLGLTQFAENEQIIREEGFLFKGDVYGINIEDLAYDWGINIKYVKESEILSAHTKNISLISEGFFGDILRELTSL